MESNTERLIKILLKDNFGVEQEVKNESKFKDDLGIDSLDYVELLMEVESKLGVQIPDAESDNIVTYGQFVTLVNKYS